MNLWCDGFQASRHSRVSSGYSKSRLLLSCPRDGPSQVSVSVISTHVIMVRIAVEEEMKMHGRHVGNDPPFKGERGSFCRRRLRFLHRRLHDALNDCKYDALLQHASVCNSTCCQGDVT